MPTKLISPVRKLRVSDIRIKRTPDEITRRPYRARVRGLTSKMGLMEFMSALFDLNETLGPRKKMTDAEMERQVLKEFPDNPTAAYFLPGKTRHLTMNYWRCLYNRGQLCPGIPKPKKPSQRYGLDGQPVHNRTGRPLPINSE